MERIQVVSVASGQGGKGQGTKGHGPRSVGSWLLWTGLLRPSGVGRGAVEQAGQLSGRGADSLSASAGHSFSSEDSCLSELSSVCNCSSSHFPKKLCHLFPLDGGRSESLSYLSWAVWHRPRDVLMLPSPSQVAVIVLSCGFLSCARFFPELEEVRGRQGEGRVRSVSV